MSPKLCLHDKQEQRRDISVTPKMSLDTHLPDHFDVGHAHHDFFHAVHLEGAHATLHRLRKQFGHAGALLDKFLDRVIGHQQFMQANTSLVARLATLVAANRPVQPKFAVFPVVFHPALHHLGALGGVVRLPGRGVAQFFRILRGK